MNNFNDIIKQRNNVSMLLVDSDTGEVLKDYGIKFENKVNNDVKLKLISRKKIKVYERSKDRFKKSKFATKYGDEYVALYNEYRYIKSIDKKILEQNSINLLTYITKLKYCSNVVTNIVQFNRQTVVHSWCELYATVGIRNNRRMEEKLQKFLLENDLIRVVKLKKSLTNTRREQKFFFLNPFYFKQSRYCHTYSLYLFLDVSKKIGAVNSEVEKYVRDHAKKIEESDLVKKFEECEDNTEFSGEAVENDIIYKEYIDNKILNNKL